jgi:hypothetical protein
LHGQRAQFGLPNPKSRAAHGGGMPLHRQTVGQAMSKHARPTRTVPALYTYSTSGDFSGLPPLATSRLPNSVTRLPRESLPQCLQASSSAITIVPSCCYAHD